MNASFMDRDTLVAANDRRLQCLLQSQGAAAEREIERLIVDDARPLVRKIVSRYTSTGRLLTAEDGEDVSANVEVRLVQKLRSIGNGPEEAISNLQGYVATLAHNTVNDFLRKRFPERARLKRRLRYALTTNPRFALWTTPAGPACGMRAWEGRQDALELVPPMSSSSIDALERIFETAGRPMLLDALLELMAEQWRAHAEPAAHDERASDSATLDAHFEDRDFAHAAWGEIRALRPMQRRALLLNLRYGGELDVLSVLLLSGVARFAELAEALEMTEQQLAAIWNDLPWDDERIAKLLGITRQQVINLRKAARKRLSRRLLR